MPAKKKKAGDAGKGEKIFKTLCAVCHNMKSHGTGPNLAGVVGRTPGTSEGFAYSGAMKDLGAKGAWSERTID